MKKTEIKIDTAASGKEAVVKAGQEKYDILFIDHMMPEMDGIEVFNRIRKDGANTETPAVALTANAVAGAKEMYLEKGFTDYLSKPVEGAKLEKMIINLLPKEKLVSEEGVSDDQNNTGEIKDDQTERNGVPAWLYDVSGLSPDEGIEYCDSAENFIELLEEYYDTVDETIEAIESAKNSGNTWDYTIRVHGLKSSSKLIGATSISEQAEKLEAAANEGDTEYTDSHTEGLIADLKKLADSISPLFIK